MALSPYYKLVGRGRGDQTQGRGLPLSQGCPFCSSTPGLPDPPSPTWGRKSPCVPSALWPDGAAVAGLKGFVHDCPLPFLLLDGPQTTCTFCGPDPLLSPPPASPHHLHGQIHQGLTQHQLLHYLGPPHWLRRLGFIPKLGRSQRRKWQPTPVFLPRKPHGQRSLAGYSL